jgi:type II secretory pathway component HofQ
MRVRHGITLALLMVVSPATAQQVPEACRDRLPTDRTTIELRGADVPTTLRLLAERFRVSLLVTPDAAGLVTVNLYEVPVRDVFETIVRTAGLTCSVREGILVVSPTERLREQERKDEEVRLRVDHARVQAEAEARKRQVEARRDEAEFAAAQARGPLREEMITLTYADADDVAKTLQGILGIRPGTVTPAPALYLPPPPIDIPSDGRAPNTTQITPGSASGPEPTSRGITVSAHPPTNSVFIRHFEADLARLKTLIKNQLDLPLPQVQIAAQMVVVSRNALEQLGVSWGGAVAGQAGRNTLVGQGFAQPVNPASGVQLPTIPPAPAGTPTLGTIGGNPPFSPSLPVNPTTGLPTGGNLVNLPLSGLADAGKSCRRPGVRDRGLALQLEPGRAGARSPGQGANAGRAEDGDAFERQGGHLSGLRGAVRVDEHQRHPGAIQGGAPEAGGDTPGYPRIGHHARPDEGRRGEQRARLHPPGAGKPAHLQAARRERSNRAGRGAARHRGIINDADTKTERKVPTLSKIPILGWLFKSRELSLTGEELIVVITPSVLPQDAAR